jgi:tRNA1Val (adenine37-N6)-methyltransferase
MGTEIFKFKQFSIEQNDSVFKVGTDGVLLAAWADTTGASRILDVGTGTGLVALVTAQKQPDARIDAIDIQKESFEIARGNVNNSKWKNNIHVFQTSFRDHAASTPFPYDLIISNPPFFIGSLKNPSTVKSMARHADSLSMNEIAEGSAKLLTPGGKLVLIYPCREADIFQQYAKQHGLFCAKKLFIRPVPGKGYERTLMEFRRLATDCEENEITIEKGPRHHYTDEFKKLTEAFYLYFLH